MKLLIILARKVQILWGTYKHFQHFLRISVNFDSVLFERGYLGYIIVTSFTFFFLKFDGNTSYLTMPQPLHQMRHEAIDRNQDVSGKDK